MRTRRNTLIWFLAGAVVIATMAGYSLWRLEKKAEVRRTDKPERGIVTAISYSEDKPSAVIDSEIVNEGETIHGVKVVKIHKDKVEFEKDGERWGQKVQERPGSGWLEAD